MSTHLDQPASARKILTTMVLGDYRTDNSNNHLQFYVIIVNFIYEQFPIIFHLKI